MLSTRTKFVLAALVLLAGIAAPGLLLAAPDHGTPAEASSHEPAAHGGTESPLEWKSDLALWTAVVFLLLLSVLWRFAWGPISQGLQKRERAIADQIAQAEKNNQEARRLLGDYQRKLDHSQEEVRAILDEARRDAEQTGRELIEKARSEATREQEKALREIEQASAVAIKELAEHGSQLAVLLAGKIVGQRLRAEDHAELIRRTLAEFPAPAGDRSTKGPR